MKWNQAWYKYSIHDNMASVESSKLTLTCALGNNVYVLCHGVWQSRAAKSSFVSPKPLQIWTQQRWDYCSPQRKSTWHELSLTAHCKGIKESPCAAGDNLLAPAWQGPARAEGNGQWRGSHAADIAPCSVPPQLHPLHNIHKRKALEECFHRFKLQLLKFWQQHASDIFPVLLKSGLRRQKGGLDEYPAASLTRRCRRTCQGLQRY